MAEAALDDVATFVALGVELGWSAAEVSAVTAVALLIIRLSDGRDDPTLSQIGPDCSGGICLISEKFIRSCSCSACSDARNIDLLDQGNQRGGVIGLPGRNDSHQR